MEQCSLLLQPMLFLGKNGVLYGGILGRWPMKQTDIYGGSDLSAVDLQTDHPEFKNWIGWLERDIETGPSGGRFPPPSGGEYGLVQPTGMRGNHDYIFGFSQIVCYADAFMENRRHFSSTDGGVPARCRAGRLSPP